MATRVCWLGHSCLAIESDGKRLLIDPFLTGNPAAKVQAETVQTDFILVSHGHADHLGDTIPIARRTGATVIANYEISEWLFKQGLTKVHGQQHGGSRTYSFGKVKFTLAFHGSALPDGSYGGNPCGFLFTFNDGTKIYDAADTALFGDMKLIGEEDLDLAFLPIGDNYTMGPEDSLRAIKFLTPRKVVPIHYNTWDVIAQDPEKWARTVRAEGLTQPVVLQPGDWLDLG